MTDPPPFRKKSYGSTFHFICVDLCAVAAHGLSNFLQSSTNIATAMGITLFSREVPEESNFLQSSLKEKTMVA